MDKIDKPQLENKNTSLPLSQGVLTPQRRGEDDHIGAEVQRKDTGLSLKSQGEASLSYYDKLKIKKQR